MASPVSAAVQSICDALPERIVTAAAQPDFNALTNKPWSSTCWQAAAAYIFPEDAGEVATALKAIRQAGIKFVVRSTGHNPNPGFSSIGSDGVVIDVGKLQSRELVDGENGNRKVARVGAGNRWGAVYEWVEEHGLSVVGGRDPDVGMGLLIGGGLGAVPNLYGLGTDGILGFEVVLSDGRIVNANTHENVDLYRALKGGGSNFGIITRFDLTTHPLIPLTYSITLYNPSDYANINRATLQMQQTIESDPSISSFTNYQPTFVAVGIIKAAISENGADDRAQDALKPFDAIESKMMEACPSTKGTLATLAKIMAGAHAGGDEKKKYIGTVTTIHSEALYNDATNAWREALDMLPGDAVLHYTIQPVGSACVREGQKVNGGNILGLEAVAQCWWVFTVEWPRQSSPDDDEAARKALDYLRSKVEDAARAKDQLLPYLAATFAGPTQPVLKRYGAENVDFIKSVAQKYDPNAVFQKQQAGGFLLRDL
ncbi:6-hydroxy-D-nicotine oxidase [Aspergillus heterothallicus]